MNLLHKAIFWSHLLAGVIAGAVILMMSFTGFVLMYESQITEYVEWQQRWVTPPSGNAKRLSLEALLNKVREIEPDARPAAITVHSDPAASVIVNLGRNHSVFVNPYTGAVLGGLSPLHHFMHEVVQWHRWFALEEENRATGRSITGACNLAFFWLAVTGVYLWWPRSWRWRGLKSSLLFNLRLSGKARDWNWHNVIGFWSSAVLMVLTLTAAFMSYPWANDLLYTLTGSEPPPRRAEGPSGGVQRARDARTAAGGEAAGPDALLARAHEQVAGWVTITIRLAGRGDAPVAVSIQEPDAWNRFQRSRLALNRATAEVVKWEPYAANSAGRKLRIWMRGLHTGEALGFAGQTVAGLASLGSCFLVWTGWAMAWRRFRYRKREAGDAAAAEQITAQTAIDAATIRAAVQRSDASKETARIEMEATDSSATNGRAHHSPEAARTEWVSAPFNGDSVLILYGTVTGNAEALAKKLAEALRLSGLTVSVRDMAHCQPNVLTQANCVLIVASTYGDGEPPDDAAPFWEAVVYGNSLDLTGVRFSVLALGNTTYDHFCKCGRELDAALERHGAARLYPRIDCDVDYDAPAKRWMDGVVAILRQERTLSATA